jgi:cardiolipin synthase
VYEYTPGFIHAKTFLCDDIVATVGTANVDYRSMYMQYECGVWMCGCKTIRDIKADILSVIEKSKEITIEECREKPLIARLAQRIIQLFAPLM